LDGFKRSLLKKLRIGGTEYSFRYFRPVMSQESLQFLDDHDGVSGHLSRAEAEAGRLAAAIAPGDAFLRTLLATAALQHDEGKRISKWQVAFGWRKGQHALAKLHPDLERPAPLHGFRHEWESLRKLFGMAVAPPPEIPPETYALWSDLLLHLVGVHHGHLRPSIADNGLTPGIETEKHNPLRLEAAKRFACLQRQLGRWRLAYLEALLKTADAEGSRVILEEEPDGN
jgi:CRISPR-associated helicase Cas3